MNRLKELRESKNLTFKELSNELKSRNVSISPNSLSKYERGARNPKIETWQALADFFDVSVPYLQGELTYDDLTPEGKKLEDRLGRTINDAINDELKYSELSSEENKRAIKLALQSALEYYA
jgi:transcriptional regulator with XRE-family HTH domain